MRLSQKKRKSVIRLNLSHYLSAGQSQSKSHLQSISKKSVLAMYLHNLESIIEDVKAKLGRHENFSLWDIRIQWDASKQKKLYKNKKIKAWHKAAQKSLPYLPVFLSVKTLGPYLSYLLDIKKIKSQKPDMVVVFYYESLVNLLSEIVIKGMAFFEYCNAIFAAGGLADEIDDEEIVNIINGFVDRSLRSLRIDNAEFNRYKESVKLGVKKGLQSVR